MEWKWQMRERQESEIPLKSAEVFELQLRPELSDRRFPLFFGQ